MRKNRMLDQLDMDEDVIARLEHKLGNSGKRKNAEAPKDELDGKIRLIMRDEIPISQF